jgi:hypothetical protein
LRIEITDGRKFRLRPELFFIGPEVIGEITKGLQHETTPAATASSITARKDASSACWHSRSSSRELSFGGFIIGRSLYTGIR